MISLQGMDILFIDDEKAVRLLARRILEGAGANLIEAESAENGLELGQKKIPHLVVTDLSMAAGSGFDFLSHWSSLPEVSDIPVLVMTGSSDEESVRKAIALGAVDYLLKPIRALSLLQRVYKWTRNRAFQSFVFSEENRPRVELAVDCEIIAIGETDLLIESPLKIGTESDMRLQPLGSRQLDLAGFVMKTTERQGVYAKPGRYVNEVKLIGPAKRRRRR